MCCAEQRTCGGQAYRSTQLLDAAERGADGQAPVDLPRRPGDTYTQEREPEEACRLAGKALEIAGPMHYSTTMERMTALRRDLETRTGGACVQQLDERLHTLPTPGMSAHDH